MRETVYWPLPTYLLCRLDSVAYGFSAPPLEAPIAPSKRPSKRGGGSLRAILAHLSSGRGGGSASSTLSGSQFWLILGGGPTPSLADVFFSSIGQGGGGVEDFSAQTAELS